MRRRAEDPLRYLDTLPASARYDLLHFIEESAETSVTDETEYLLEVLALHRAALARRGAGVRRKA